MLKLQDAKHQRSKKQRQQTPRIGLAMAGGGPLGAIYELGALRALDESIDGLSLHNLDTYVGVSAGAFVAASLANQLSTAQICRIFMGRKDAEHTFRPEAFLKPAYYEYARQLKRIPKITRQALMEFFSNPLGYGVSETFSAISQLLPTGVFDNNTIHDFIKEILSVSGRSNNFNELTAKLFIIAVELDTGAAIRFGSDEIDDVSIARAVQASAALPGLYPPVNINGVDYVDGALRRTLHASVALNEDIDLLIGINPLVPYNALDESQQQKLVDLDEKHRLGRNGLTLVLSQTFRAMIQSRMQIGIGKYQDTYPNSGIMLVEPNRNDETMFFTNIFSYSSRTSLCEHAYQTTRQELLHRQDDLQQFFEPYGLKLNAELLADKNRTLADSLGKNRSGHSPVSRSLYRALDRLRHSLDNKLVA